MLLLDARRLTGPNLYTRGPAVIAELSLAEGEDPGVVADAYFGELERLTRLVGLASPRENALPPAPFRGGVAVVFTGPIDTLLASAEAAEWAAESAAGILAGKPSRELEPKGHEIAAMVEALHCPRLLALEEEAKRRDLPFLWDDERVSIGAGARCRTWPRGELPSQGAVPWSDLGTIPIALVTGTNGKTTSARLIARMVREAGRVVGNTSTDGVTVNEVFVERGDCTGPFAARGLLTRPEVEVAVLETARGGILRRGLAVRTCDAALLTNVSDDHLGTYGIDDVGAMARVKAVVGRAARRGGRVVLNADDAELAKLSGSFAANVVLFSQDPDSALVREHATRGGEVWLARGGKLARLRGGEQTSLLALADIPIAYGGAARFNVENALGAAATAAGLGLGDAAITAGLRAFRPTPADNPGRANLVDVAGIRVLLDFGHNPQAVRAVLDLVATLRAGHRLTVVTGQAGDRTDDALRAVARTIAQARPDRVLLRELPHHLRGRAPGEVRAILRDELIVRGQPAASIDSVSSEVAALDGALATAAPGDVILMLVHIEREAVRELLASKGATG